MDPTWRLWYRAARPFSFTASIIPVLVGSALGVAEAWQPLHFVLALSGAVLIHAGTNFVNDYFDDRKGADSPDSLGPSGVIQRGVFSARAVLIAGLLCFAAGALLGLVLVGRTSLSLLWLGLASMLAGFLYTGGPLALAYIALGEVTVFIFMGPVITLGAWFVQTERWAARPALVALPIALLVAAILHANNLRDIDDDRKAGKRTVATVIGRRAATVEYYLLVGGAFGALVALVAVGVLPWPALLALVTAPIAWRLVRIVRAGGDPRRLNPVVRGSAQLHFRFGMLMTLGLLAAPALAR